MSKDDEEFDIKFGDIFQKCDNDADKFMSMVTRYLRENSDFFNDAKRMKQTLDKYFSSMEPVAAASPVMNNSYGRILVPATQYALDESSRDSGASDNLVINETTESKNITGVSEPGDEDFEDDIIPETQYMPDQVSNAGDSRPVSRQSSQPDFGTNDDHFEPPINADALLKSSANENESDEDNELIHVDQDSNAPWQLEESQAVIGHVETELLDNVQSRSVCNDKLTDSIDLSSSRLEDASKLDVEAPVQSATKTNNKLEQNVNMSAASISSSLEVDRSTSVTPDLDIVMTPIASTRSTGRAESTPRPIEANKSLEEDILRTFPQKEDRSSSHALSEVKTSQVNRLSSVAHDANDDRSVTPDLFTQAIINAPTVNEPIGIDPMVAEMTDDSLSNDNDLYGTSTQAFPLPPPQPVRVAQESNIPALEADEDSVEKEATVDAATAVDQDGDSVNNDADDADSNDFYNAQTQINPLAKASVTPLKMPLSGHSSTENSLNKSANNRMAPPALPNKPRESLANDVSATESNKPAEDDLFAAATQVFVPVQPAAISKKKSLSLAADPSDSIYDRETQKIVSLDESAKKNRKSVRTTQEIWPTSTPVKSVVANLPVKSIEEKGRLVEGKPKTWLSKKWLFDSEADCDDERDPSPPPKRSRSSTKKCVSDTNVPLTSKVAKRIVGDPYVSEAEIEQINKRRVSVVLERPKIDVNSNESPASAYPATNKSDRNAEKAPTASNRPNGSSDDAASVSHQKGRKTKILTEKAVSDISPNRPTRAKAVNIDNDLRVYATARSRSANRKVFESSKDLEEKRSTSRSSGKSTDVPVTSPVRISPRSASTAEARDSRASDNGRTHRIMFTKVDMERRDIKSAVKRIPTFGGEIVDSPTICTVLICEKIYRTNKLMGAIGRGIPIVTPKWLIASQKKKHFIDPEPYLIEDTENEMRFGFNLKTSLEMARKKALFENYVVFTTPNIVPPPNEITTIVQCGGGHCTNKYKKSKYAPRQLKKLVVSSPDDLLSWKEIRAIHPDIPIISTEGLMRAVMRQKIDFSRFRLCK